MAVLLNSSKIVWFNVICLLSRRDGVGKPSVI